VRLVKGTTLALPPEDTSEPAPDVTGVRRARTTILGYHSAQPMLTRAQLDWDHPQGAGMATPSAPPTETILVVDDEAQVLGLVAELLRAQGYAVLSTWDPDEALRIARAHTGSIQLLLSDLVMPVMTGQELATELCAIYPDLKVLFMSAYSVETAEDYNVRLAPGEPFLGKPFSIAGLQRTVRDALDYEAPSSPHLIQ
jgi:two-component system, cell cycle sensor histidine kinase and response regulator CckA